MRPCPKLKKVKSKAIGCGLFFHKSQAWARPYRTLCLSLQRVLDCNETIIILFSFIRILTHWKKTTLTPFVIYEMIKNQSTMSKSFNFNIFTFVLQQLTIEELI
jgi:hypothetical protein